MIIETVKMAFNALTSSKVRSFLSMLGIIIGVCTVIVVFAIGQGAQKDVADQYKNLSANSIMIMGSMGGGGRQGEAASSSKLSEDDVQSILNDSHYIASAAAVIETSTTVAYDQATSSGSIMGVNNSFFGISNLNIQYGRVFTEAENTDSNDSVVLGNTVATDLFGTASQSIVGETVTVNDKKLNVIGVMKKNGSSSSMMNYDASIFVPYNYAKKKLVSGGGRNNVRIIALVNDVSNVTAATDDVTTILRTAHGLSSDKDDDFRIMDAGSMVGAAQSSASTLTTLLTLVATVVLLVSGIGIMNVMFVTVAERTKEIGIAKAVGGTQSEILGQFLIESIMLSMIGGLLGVGLGQTAISVISKMKLISVVPSSTGMAIGFGFSVVVGIFFGFYPALKASKLDPVDALRSE
jgi:putative ABC transport system permease protein